MNVCHKEDIFNSITMLSTFQAFEKGNLVSCAAPLVMIGGNGVNENFK